MCVSGGVMGFSADKLIIGACLSLFVITGCHMSGQEHASDSDEMVIKEETSVVGLPNPFVKVNSIAEAEAAIGKKIPQLRFIPDAYQDSPEIFVMNESEMVQLMYSSADGSERMLYRISEKFSTELLNGDYTKYAINKKIKIRGHGVLVKGNGDGQGYYTAEWSVGGLNLCILSDVPLTDEVLNKMIK